MNKKNGLRLGLEAVFLVVFNAVFFLASGTEHPTSVWIAYAFIHFSYLMILLTPHLTRKSSSASVFGFSLYTISTFYFIIQLVVGIAVILIKPEVYRTSLIIQIILLGIYAVCLLSTLLANETTADNIQRHESEVFYIKETASRIGAMVGRMEDKRANKELEKAYDALHSSPSKSNHAVRSLEKEITDQISNLEGAVLGNDPDSVIQIAKSVCYLVEERNRQLSGR